MSRAPRGARRAPAAQSLPRSARRAGRRPSLPVRIFTPARAAGLLGMLAAGFLYSFATGPTAFGLSATEVPALRWTDAQLVRDTLAVPEGSNVFRLATGPLAARLRALPAVRAADVSVSLPDARLLVSVAEREPILAWRTRDAAYLVDRGGVVFARLEHDAQPPAGVGVIDDLRAGADANLGVGSSLDPIDLDVATRLGSLTPDQVGSAADSLGVAVSDADGFVVRAAGGWTAVFGVYSPATRSTDIIPGQVRLLRSLLVGREGSVARVVLASATDGTYTTPRPS